MSDDILTLPTFKNVLLTRVGLHQDICTVYLHTALIKG